MGNGSEVSSRFSVFEMTNYVDRYVLKNYGSNIENLPPEVNKGFSREEQAKQLASFLEDLLKLGSII